MKYDCANIVSEIMHIVKNNINISNCLIEIVKQVATPLFGDIMVLELQ